MTNVLILALTGMMLTLCREARSDDHHGPRRIPPLAVAAQVGAPYVVGEWFLGDVSSDTPSVTTDDTQFIFLNPPDHKQFTEYAFFDPDGTFCGCDRDVKN